MAPICAAEDASEADLQADLRDSLKGNLVSAEVLSEVRGVATGRTDLYISFGGPTFVIELKKHDGEFSREAAERYRPQATSYQAANVRLGFIGVTASGKKRSRSGLSRTSIYEA
ncbi:hypothetical protein NB311A_00235 [Nitrobacter sp. Nb-311A]|uniref:hypothetical protein n=1 Tax=Nitrobacter sp. Nb-311A TaxID=314253 RepID=UPI0000684D29|nr:hypothetical protein [Nitrobacter sp. Nb-311A]EAQ33712.1 hypothetical protein NB311A_00235 [Nitrobacter sp. Nb-311A]